MEPYIPDTPLREQLDVAYAPATAGIAAADTTMDVFTSAAAGDVLPTVVWVHGGAWISGSKRTSTHICASSRTRATRRSA